MSHLSLDPTPLCSPSVSVLCAVLCYTVLLLLLLLLLFIAQESHQIRVADLQSLTPAFFTLTHIVPACSCCVLCCCCCSMHVYSPDVLLLTCNHWRLLLFLFFNSYSPSVLMLCAVLLRGTLEAQGQEQQMQAQAQQRASSSPSAAVASAPCASSFQVSVSVWVHTCLCVWVCMCVHVCACMWKGELKPLCCGS